MQILMIAGIGTDIVSVERLRHACAQEAFAERAFTEKERLNAAHFRDPSEHLAGRWAAKEALAKALGTGFGERCQWQEIEVVNDAAGKPEMTLAGKTLEFFRQMGGQFIHLSISHEREFAVAFVVIER